MPTLKFSPEGIVDLCQDLPPAFQTILLNQLESAWDEFEDFEVELEVPMWEEPYGYFLKVMVEPPYGIVTIKRSLS